VGSAPAVCEIEYAELTADDQLRQTTFLGWRDDKNPKEVLLQEKPSVLQREGEPLPGPLEVLVHRMLDAPGLAHV